MSERFCLVDEGWIPCERRDGSRVELGIKETLARADELRAIADSSPLVTAALHRLLLAVLHRCFGPPNIDAWIELYRAGCFDPTALNEYLDRWRERFDLFHPERPFYQVRGLPFEPKPIRELVSEQSNWGNGVFLFEHRPSDTPATLSFAEAAKWLLVFHACAPEGRVGGEPLSARAAPFNDAALVIMYGATLFETLLLNTLVYAPEDGQPIPGWPEKDLPAWERAALPQSLAAESREPRRVPDGWVDLLTWQSRRLELHAASGSVVGCVRCVGQGLIDDAPRDAMVAWKAHEQHGCLPLGFDRRRALWRDSGALFRTVDHATDVTRPKALNQLAQPDLRNLIPADRRFSLDVLGMSGKKASIFLVRAERVPVSPKLLSDPDLGESVREVLGFAETAVGALGYSLFVLASHALAPGERKSERKDIRQLVQSLGAEAVFWSRAKSHFDAYLERVGDDERGARRAFAEAMRREARKCFNDVSGALGTSARVLKGAALAADSLGRKLVEIPRFETPEVTP